MIPLTGDLNLLLHSNGRGIVSSQLTVQELLEAYTIDHEINRDLNYARIPDIVKYLESQNIAPGIFIPSFVFSYRGDPNKCHDMEHGLFLLEDSSLITIDGQHRIKAMERYVHRHQEDTSFLNNTVTVQVYFGLSREDERQLFVDINSNAKKVSRSLVMKYDSREVSNLLIKEVHRNSASLQVAGIELDKSKVQRPANTAFATGQRLKTFLAYLLVGKKKFSQHDEELLAEHYDQIVAFLNQFFLELFNVLPDTPGDVRRYVLGHEPVQNAIALYFHDMFISLTEYGLQVTGIWEDAIADIGVVDWTSDNVNWRRMGVTKSTQQGQYLGFNESETSQIYNHIQKMVTD